MTIEAVAFDCNLIMVSLLLFVGGHSKASVIATSINCQQRNLYGELTSELFFYFTSSTFTFPHGYTQKYFSLSAINLHFPLAELDSSLA